ncbi:MBOAT family O-acyltransferase [Ruminococcus sp.]|uniref:MBOAT family O-acyltransferase n=1 Tax=Ruminococcus sp. TaxID=41978 RepID=UPI002E77C70F|nr:MBOAT family O-acyltransferase [Ruminococcus sp.]MEE1263611.1 MBOAT family O-acyltransferase [Ruminococcus sp.]
MTYTSLNFIFFVLATALVYFVLPFKKYRWTVLLAASIFFYCTWSYQLGAFMLFTTLSTYLIALWLSKASAKSKAVLKAHKSEWSRDDKKKYKNKTKVRMRLIMTLALLLNFGILAFLKYYNFFAGSLNDILGAFSLDFSAPSLKLILPLGISFYTFQSMGYIVDVYREKTEAQKNPLKLLLFVSFFPQIIQGPISIYDQLAVQLFEGHDFDFTRFKHGCELIMWGFFKKLVIADRAVIPITAVTAEFNKFGGTTLTFTILLYALQLYADFSGGIDISRGVAQIFGVDMIDNFKRPYFSRSINEYWRRWHISLGAWLKNYLFYPVAMSNAFITASKKMKGTRFGKTAAGAHISKVLPTSVASLIVFLVVGIWHGASWKYVAFGAWNGLIIMVSILLEPLFISAKDKLHIKDTNIPFMLFQMFRTFLIVLVGYVFDVAPSFSQAMRTFWLFFTNQNFKLGYSQISDLGLGKKDYLVVLIGGLIIFIASVIQERAKDGLDIRHMLDKKPFILRFALLFVCLISIVVFGIYGSGYSAADFVYAQF